MDYQLLRSWLELPPGPWPPDHYRLLDLEPGEGSTALIEKKVLERMETLRRRQLLHPELCTEGMNQLAQALITLSDSKSKQAYDAQLGILSQPVLKTSTRRDGQTKQDRELNQPIIVTEVVDDDAFSDDLLQPRPIEPGEVTEILAQIASEPRKVETHEIVRIDEPIETYEVVPSLIAGTEVIPNESTEDRHFGDVQLELVDDRTATLSNPIHRERSTDPSLRSIYRELAQIRLLARSWDRIGAIVGDPGDEVDRPARALLFLDSVRKIRPLLDRVNGIGGIDEPGGLVGAIVRQRLVLDTFRRLIPSQRQAVAIDWRRGRDQLRQNYNRLRQECNTRRQARRGVVHPLAWRKRAPELVLVALAILAYGIAMIRQVATR